MILNPQKVLEVALIIFHTFSNTSALFSKFETCFIDLTQQSSRFCISSSVWLKLTAAVWIPAAVIKRPEFDSDQINSLNSNEFIKADGLIRNCPNNCCPSLLQNIKGILFFGSFITSKL